MPYNPNHLDYTGSRPEKNQSNQTQTWLMQNYTTENYSVIDKEIKGGLHRVKYKSHLIQDTPGNTGAFKGTYDGVFLTRRVKGMLVYVELEDNDTPCDKYFSLQTFPGTSLSHWVEVGAGSPITITGQNQVVADIAARDAITGMATGDMVTVLDARTPQEVTDGDPIYPSTYIWNGTQWVVISPYGADPMRHAKNNDTQLIRASNGAVVTADIIATHIADDTKHLNINDANDTGATNEQWSSAKTREELDKKLTPVTNGDGTLFLANDGSYKAVTGSGGTGGGLNRGDILNGGTSVEY